MISVPGIFGSAAVASAIVIGLPGAALPASCASGATRSEGAAGKVGFGVAGWLGAAGALAGAGASCFFSLHAPHVRSTSNAASERISRLDSRLLQLVARGRRRRT